VFDQSIPIVFVEMQDHLGVAAGSKLVAASLKLVAKVDVVIDLAVVAENKRSIHSDGLTATVLEHHWLGSLIAEADDGEPSVAEPHPTVS
jgi:hypothetical protein